MNSIEHNKSLVGERIRQRRIELGLKQSDVATALGVTMQAVSLWETGKVSPGGSTVPRLAEVLQCQITWLLKGRGADDELKYAMEEFDKKRGESSPTKDALFHIHNKRLYEFIPAFKKDDLAFAKKLLKLIQLYCDIDEEHRDEVLRHTIEQWKEHTNEKMAKLDDLYKDLKNFK